MVLWSTRNSDTRKDTKSAGATMNRLNADSAVGVVGNVVLLFVEGVMSDSGQDVAPRCGL